MTRWGDQSKTHSQNDQNNAERSLGDACSFLVLILSEEEQRGETDLLEVETDKYVRHGLGEEQTAGVARLGHVELPEEKVLPHLEEKEERHASQAVDDGRNDRVRDRDNRDEGWQTKRS